MSEGTTPRFGFVIEQTLGHVSYYRNLRRVIDGDPELRASWYPLGFEPESGIERMPFLRNNWSARASWRSRRVLTRDRVETKHDALFFHTQVTTLLCRSLMRRVPSIISLDATPRNYDSVGAAYGHQRGGGGAERLKAALNARTLRAARALIPFSEWARTSLIEDYGVSPEQVRVIPPGIDTTEWSVPVGNRNPTALGERSLRLLFVGGDFVRKGGPLLLEIFRQHLRDRCALHIVTKTPVQPERGVHVYSQFRPNQPGLRQLYASSDVLVLPTLGDCFSFAAIEGMACGLPVIASAVGGIPEIVRDGDTGFLIPPADGNALLGAIEGLLSSPQQVVSMGLAGRTDVERRFNSAINTRRVLDVLVEVARS